MNRSTPHRWTSMRGAFLALALLSVALKMLAPTGFMAVSEPKNGLPFALVLCTGQGPLIVEPGDTLGHHDDEAPADKPAHDAPCPFASQGVGAPPPNALTIARIAFVAYQPVEPVRVVRLAPGRGLAAPPLPARGPPEQLI